jgi:prolyl-tRNA editing enzyme YbaK/EbsC (Cys-tRNA(Pro) deacylase)
LISAIPPATERVLATARTRGLDLEVHQFPEGTKTAADAAAAIGCPVAAIVKSLVFVVGEEPVLALVPGDLMLDPRKLEAIPGTGPARRATLEEVRSATGFAAGGTPPFGHVQSIRVFADEALRRNDPVWAAAGTPTTVFPISLRDLDLMASPSWTDLSSEKEGSRHEA